MRRVTIEAHASSANLGPGFDCFAVSLGRPRDKVTLRLDKARKFSVWIKGVTGQGVPRSPKGNSAGAVCLAIGRALGLTGRVVVEVEKGVPIGLGMGSSGASSAAAAVAMNALFNLGLKSDELILYSGHGEQAASGTFHYDNVAAAILGGFVLVVGGSTPSAIRFDAPKDLSLCLVTPFVRLPARKTEYARSLVPKTVELRKMISNVSNASLMVAGFARGETSLIGRGMSDTVVEEVRKKMIPGYDKVRGSALRAGASGVCISGAGPSVLAAVDRRVTEPKSVLAAMISAFKGEGLKANGFVTRVGGEAREIESG